MEETGFFFGSDFGNPEAMLIEKMVGLFTRRVGRILETYKDTCSPTVGTSLTKRTTAV